MILIKALWRNTLRSGIHCSSKSSGIAKVFSHYWIGTTWAHCSPMKPNSKAEYGHRPRNLSFVWCSDCACVPDRHVSLEPCDIHLQSSLEGPKCVLWCKLDTHKQTQTIFTGTTSYLVTLLADDRWSVDSVSHQTWPLMCAKADRRNVLKLKRSRAVVGL